MVFVVKDKTYDLTLRIKNIYKFEKLTNHSVYDMVMGLTDGKMPTISDMATLLAISMDKRDNPNNDINKALDIFGEWCEDGHMPLDFVNIVVELFKEAGILKDNTEDDE